MSPAEATERRRASRPPSRGLTGSVRATASTRRAAP